MELTEDKLKVVEGQKPTYKITREELCTAATRIKNIDQFKPLFFRYLGLQQFTYPFALYRKLLEQVTTSSILIDNHVSSESINCLLAVLAIATTDQRSLKYDPQPIIVDILAQWRLLSNVDIFLIISRTNQLCLQGLKPDLYQVQGILQLFTQLGNKDELVNLSLNYAKQFKEYGTSLAQALANLGRWKVAVDLTSLTQFLHELFNSEIAKNNELMPKILSALGSFNFTNTQPDKFINLIKRFIPNSLETLHNLLNVLAEINVAHSDELPDFTIFDIDPNVISSKSAILQFITQRYPKTNFSSQSLAAYSEDCKSELIVLLSDSKVAQMLSTFGQNANQLIGQIQQDKNGIQIDALLEQFNNGISMFPFADRAIKTFVINKFTSASISNAIGLVKELALPETIANPFIKQLVAYMGVVNSDQELNDFITRVRQVKALIRVLKGHKSSNISDCVTTLTNVLEKNDDNKLIKNGESH